MLTSSDEKWMYVMSEKFSSFDDVSQLGQMFTSGVESKIEVNNYTITMKNKVNECY